MAVGANWEMAISRMWTHHSACTLCGDRLSDTLLSLVSWPSPNAQNFAVMIKRAAAQMFEIAPLCQSLLKYLALDVSVSTVCKVVTCHACYLSRKQVIKPQVE